MKVLRVIDALQLPEVLAGTKWMVLPLPAVGGWQPPPDFTLPQQTIGIDPKRMRMYWCDGACDPRAMQPSHFSGEVALLLPQLLGLCTLVDPPAVSVEHVREELP